MNLISRQAICRFLSLPVLLLVISINLFAQTDKSATKDSDKATIESLLTEVRQIRIALGQVNGAQVIINHIRVEQEHIDRLNKEVESVRQQIIESESMVLALTPELDRMQKKVDIGVTNPDELSRLKSAIDGQEKLQQNLHIRDAQMTKELDSERAILSTLNGRLDKLEQEMQKPQSAEKPQDGKK